MRGSVSEMKVGMQPGLAFLSQCKQTHSSNRTERKTMSVTYDDVMIERVLSIMALRSTYEFRGEQEVRAVYRAIRRGYVENYDGEIRAHMMFETICGIEIVSGLELSKLGKRHRREHAESARLLGENEKEGCGCGPFYCLSKSSNTFSLRIACAMPARRLASSTFL